MQGITRSPKKLFPLSILGAAVGALAGAYTAQYVFGLEPCILCLYQRVPFAVAIVLAGLALWRPAWVGGIMAALVGVFVIEAGIAFYHTGVEQHWWAAATGCSSGEISAGGPRAMLQNITQSRPKPCDEVDWTFMGVSMASWNVLFSSVLAAWSLAGHRAIRKQGAGQYD